MGAAIVCPLFHTSLPVAAFIAYRTAGDRPVETANATLLTMSGVIGDCTSRETHAGCSDNRPPSATILSAAIAPLVTAVPAAVNCAPAARRPVTGASNHIAPPTMAGAAGAAPNPPATAAPAAAGCWTAGSAAGAAFGAGVNSCQKASAPAPMVPPAATSGREAKSGVP